MALWNPLTGICPVECRRWPGCDQRETRL